MPHGHCYLWEPGILTLHIVSDALITLAYFSIPFTLVYFVRKRADLQFHWMFLCFALFIVACGTTHLMEIWAVWHPTYWLTGSVKAITALASVPTAIALVRLMPKALALPSPEDLRQEIAERKRAEAKVRQINDQLEQRVAERTAELMAANSRLKLEIEERQRAERQVRDLNAGLEQRVAQRTDALQAANHELEAFSCSVSHDLRAPLRGIQGFSTLLLEDYSAQLDDRGKGYLNRVCESTRRMGEIIDDLLSLARLSQSELTLQRVDLSGLCRSIANDLRHANPERQVEWAIAPDLMADADLRLVRAALANLLANAWKFTSKQTQARIEVGTTFHQGRKAFFVRDNGAGFDMNYVNKLFTAFQRLHVGQEFEGHGIGLATVRRVVHRHGGEVWAEGHVGRGATFYFTLPETVTGMEP